MKRTVTEKKEYISPVSEVVEIGTLNMLALSKEDTMQIHDEEQWSKEHRGDWDNIWENM